MSIFRIVALFAMLSTGLILHAQTAAELLQKGIYTQETVGDLDAAIRIYQQVVALGADARAQAAQAQYRLGLCLLRKGSVAEAAKAFNKVIADYPEQKELVAAARQQSPGGLKLIAPPWVEGETLRLKLRLPTGIAIGYYVHTIEKSGGGNLVLTSRTHTPGANQFSRSEAELDSLRPKASAFRHTILGDYKLSYSGQQVRVEANGKETKPLDLSQTVFDNEAAVALFRRLPLSEGYKTQLEIVSPLGTMVFPITVDVTAVEEIATPAGKFRAFKLEISPIRQTFWISTDAHRYLVKMEVNGATADLDEIARVDAGPTLLRDTTEGVSITLPANWLNHRAELGATKPYFNAAIFDPEAKCQCAIWAGKIERDLRAEMTAKAEDRVKNFKNYKIRSDSWTPRQINGVEALSVIADFEEMNRPMVEYLTLLKQDVKGMVLFARFQAGDLAAFRPQFDRIVESARFQ